MIFTEARRPLALGITVLALIASAIAPANPSLAQEVDDPERVRELAERLFASGSSAGLMYAMGGASPRLTARLLPGQLPDGLPLTIPIPAGGQIVGSVERTINGQLAGADVLLEAPGTTTQLRELYENALLHQGWVAPASPPAGGFQQRGFQQSSPVLSYMRCAGDDWGTALVMFGTRDAGRAEVWLSISLPAPARATDSFNPVATSPCAMMAGSGTSQGSPSFRRDLLTELRSPVGSRLQIGGGAMGPDYATTEATVETRLSAGELEAAFGRQLERHGWVKLDSGDAGSVAFSSWALPHEPDWSGMLAIMATPTENRYAVSVRVETASTASGVSLDGAGE